jgi:hypothetical protein
VQLKRQEGAAAAFVLLSDQRGEPCFHRCSVIGGAPIPMAHRRIHKVDFGAVSVRLNSLMAHDSLSFRLKAAFLFLALGVIGAIASLYVSAPSGPLVQGGFTTLPPGATLPSDETCAARIHRASWEPRPDNVVANRRVPTQRQVAGLTVWGPSEGLDARADAFRKRVSGNFTGTTNEILQWVACKWGVDENLIRAQADIESNWHQAQLGDYTTNRNLCPPGVWDGAGCYQSYGLLQVKYSPFPSAWPMSRDDSAFNVDYAYAVMRTCYEGWTTYLADRQPSPGYPRYRAGDILGCMGRWYSGFWYDAGAIDYVHKVQGALADARWLKPSF